MPVADQYAVAGALAAALSAEAALATGVVVDVVGLVEVELMVVVDMVSTFPIVFLARSVIETESFMLKTDVGAVIIG